MLGEATRGVPVLPPIDQWGALPLPLQRLSPHSLSRRARDLLAGDLGAHRDLPVDGDPEPLVSTPEKQPVIAPAPGNGYDAVDAPRRGTAAAVTLTTWPGSSTCSPTSNGAPTTSTDAPPNWSRAGCRECAGHVRAVAKCSAHRLPPPDLGDQQ